MDCSCLASLTVVIGEPVWGVVIKDGCGEWRQDWVNRKRQERWKAVVLMRCPEERSPAWRRLFFTLFVTQVSCPAQLGRWEATPSHFFSFCISSHNLCSFALFLSLCFLWFCMCGTSLCSTSHYITDLSIFAVSFVPVCLSICHLLTMSVFESSAAIFLSLFFCCLSVTDGFCKGKMWIILSLFSPCRSGNENNCWFEGALSAFY